MADTKTYGLDPMAQEFWPASDVQSANTHIYHYAPVNHQYYVYHVPVSQLPSCVPVLPPGPNSPTRTIVLSSVPSDVGEAAVRMEMESFGETRCVQMERENEGIITVHFYDIRASERALHSIRAQHIRQQSILRAYVDSGTIEQRVLLQYPIRQLGTIAGRAVWAQFIIPCCNRLPDGNNQGTIVLFNLDPDVPSSDLEDIFRDFGDIKDIRETPLKKQQRFIEFYDVRDAARALSAMDGKELRGMRMLIEFSRPGGYGKMFAAQAGDKSLGMLDSESSCQHREQSLQVLSKVKVKGYGRSSRRSKISKRFDIRCLVNGVSTFDNTCDEDKRTTVMIQNIPNKYSQQLLLDMLDRHCVDCNKHISDRDDDPMSAYDFVYLPIDFTNKCNVGYGFVNLTSPQAAMRLYKEFHLRKWRDFNSRKICEITYARVQGLKALKEHFKNSKFPREIFHYLPATFSPPRDGNIRSSPLPL